MHKWNNPFEWLADYTNHITSVNSLRDIINTLMQGLDSDAIQDCFQAEMDSTGYFDTEDEK